VKVVDVISRSYILVAYFIWVKFYLGGTQWPSGLRRVSAADRLLGLRVRIPAGAWMSLVIVLK
jgi:hypothetical protein